MKRILISFGMLMVFSHSLWAQLQSYIEDASGSFGPTAGSSVVRNFNDDYAIGFFKDAATSYFYAVDVNSGAVPFTNGNRMPVSAGWEVKDIYFHNNEAFFCGNNGTNGIIGRFPLDKLIAGSGPVSVEYVTFSSKKPSRLVAFSNASFYGVVAIDSCSIVICNFPSLSYCTYTFSGGELVHDVLLKGDTLLYIGTNFSNNCVTVRRSSCTTPTTVSHPWCYYPASSSTHIITTGSIATLLPNDQMAVVHQVSNEDNNFEMDMLVINLPNMLCIDRHAFVNLHRVRYHDLKYIPTTQRLELLYTDFALYDRYVLEWQPLQNYNYPANVLQPVLRYNSMDRIGDKCFFMVSGFHWMLQNTLSGGWTNSCESHWLTNVIHKQVHNSLPFGTDEYFSLPLSISPMIYNTAVNSFNVAIDCLH